MIFKSQNPLSPTVTIEIDGVSVDYKSIHSVCLSLEENKHDVATITFNGLHPKAITDYINAAVRVTASIGSGRSVEFCGYVTYVEPESTSYSNIVNKSIFQKAKVVCFGASISMKNVITRAWENASVLSIASDLANSYSFSLETINDSFSIPKIVQTKQSDWEFITKFCKKYGYAVTVHGTHMRLWDVNRFLGRVQSFEILSTPRKVTELQPGSIINFSGTFGYLTPEGKAYNYTLESVGEDGKVIKTTGNSNKNQTLSGVGESSKYSSSIIESSNSVIESEKMIEGRMKEALPFNATVRTAVALGTIPGGVVMLEGYDSNFEGFWYVRSVEHELLGSNCISTLKISKDFNTTNKSIFPPSEVGSTPPSPQFINKTWKTSVERIESYV